MLEVWLSDEAVGSSISCNRADAAGQRAWLSRSKIMELQNGGGGKGPPEIIWSKPLLKAGSERVGW